MRAAGTICGPACAWAGRLGDGQLMRAALTAYLVSGSAPGMVTGHERPIANVVRETFTIGG
jgi:hypothetical protein